MGWLFFLRVGWYPNVHTHTHTHTQKHTHTHTHKHTKNTCEYIYIYLSVSARIGGMWNKFRELSGMIVREQVLPLKQAGKIYVHYVRHVLLHLCETLELTVENEATLHSVECCMIYICYMYISYIIIYTICSRHILEQYPFKPIPLDLCSNAFTTDRRAI